VRSRFPFGNDRQKSKGKCKGRSFASLRMTNQCSLRGELAEQFVLSLRQPVEATPD